MKHTYRFKFYINAKHSVNFSGVISNIHPHTWETVLYISVTETEFINFTKFEKLLEGYFTNFEGKYLNSLENFKDVQPTMENIGNLFFEDITRYLNPQEFQLYKLEISENPTRTYIIEN